MCYTLFSTTRWQLNVLVSGHQAPCRPKILSCDPDDRKCDVHTCGCQVLGGKNDSRNFYSCLHSAGNKVIKPHPQKRLFCRVTSAWHLGTSSHLPINVHQPSFIVGQLVAATHQSDPVANPLSTSPRPPQHLPETVTSNFRCNNTRPSPSANNQISPLLRVIGSL